MAIALILGLVGVAFYLIKRLSEANAENAALRGQVASLKRRLRNT